VVRKTVTVLLADVTGSTGMGERLDPETLRRVMTRYFEVSRATPDRPLT
jgi:class 3 adenylate cyclase